MMNAESAREEWSTYTEELENALISKLSDELLPPTESLNLDRYEDDDDGKEDTCQNTNGSPELVSATMGNMVEIAEAELEQEGKNQGRAEEEEESGDVEKISTAEEHLNEIDEGAEEVVSRFEDLCEESIAEFGKRMELHVRQKVISADEPERTEDDDDDDVVITATKPDVDEVGDRPNELQQDDEAVEIIEETKTTTPESCSTDHNNPSPSSSSARSGLRRAFDFLKIRRTNKIDGRCQSSASKGSDSRQSALCILQ